MPWPQQREPPRTERGMEGVSTSTDDQENVTEAVPTRSWTEGRCSSMMTVRERGKLCFIEIKREVHGLGVNRQKNEDGPREILERRGGSNFYIKTAHAGLRGEQEEGAGRGACTSRAGPPGGSPGHPPARARGQGRLHSRLHAGEPQRTPLPRATCKKIR